jgi:Spy/CpxP family protein refolding chaperone
MLSQAAIEGPASPDIMRDSIGLNGSQLQGYTRRYENHMANTKEARDSLRTEVQAMRAAFESGDRSAARDQRDRMEQQSKELSKQDEAFDNGLKDILTKDQQKQYKKWKDNREKAERAQWSQRRSSGNRDGWVNQVQVR